MRSSTLLILPVLAIRAQEEAVQACARMVGAGEAAAAKAHRRDAEVAAVLLHEQIGRAG